MKSNKNIVLDLLRQCTGMAEKSTGRIQGKCPVWNRLNAEDTAEPDGMVQGRDTGRDAMEAGMR